MCIFLIFIIKYKVIDEVIVGKTSIYLLTIDNKKIKITDIIDIEKSIS